MSLTFQALCLFDFSSRQRDELTIKKGSIVDVLYGPQTTEDWWLVRNLDGRSGLVPCNYLQIKPLSPVELSRSAGDGNPFGDFERDTSGVLPVLIRPELEYPIMYSSNGIWQAARDGISGDTYYFNRKTGQSQWEFPDGISPSSAVHCGMDGEELITTSVNTLKRAFPAEDKTRNEDETAALTERLKVAVEMEQISTDTFIKENTTFVPVLEPTRFDVNDESVRRPLSSEQDVKIGIVGILSDNSIMPPQEALPGCGLDEQHLPQIFRKQSPLVKSVRLEPEKENCYRFPPVVSSVPMTNHTPECKAVTMASVVSNHSSEPYQHRRSKLYAPTAYDATRPQLTENKNTKLELSFCFGYNGDHKKYHGAASRIHGGCVSRNIFWLNEDIIMYPAAAVVVLMTTALDVPRQAFFNVHTEEITAITFCASSRVAASAQSGRNPRVLLWSLDHYLRPLLCNQESESSEGKVMEISFDGNCRGVSDLSISDDGIILAVVTWSETQMLFLYDLSQHGSERTKSIVSVKLGHAEVSHFSFNQYQFKSFRWPEVSVDSPCKGETPLKSRSESGDAPVPSENKIEITNRNGRKDSGTIYAQAEGCYTLYCCINRSLKVWTLHKYRELIDPGVVEVSGFKARRMSMPKRMQHWMTKYHLVGQLCYLPKNLPGAPSSEVTCCCPMRDSDNDSCLPTARLLCGTAGGSIVVWRQREASPDEDIYSLLNGVKSKVIQKQARNGPSPHLCWVAKADFVCIITDVHDGPIHDVAVKISADISSWCNTVFTCGRDNIINVWHITQAKLKDCPMEHVKSISLRTSNCDSADEVDNISGKERFKNNKMEGVGRTLSVSPGGLTIAVGLTSNSIYRISCDGLSISTATTFIVAVDTLMKSHIGSVKRCAAHPKQKIFATIASDRSVRLWSTIALKQIGVVYIRDDALSSVCFSPDGKYLIVGTATLGNILVFHIDFTHGFGVEDFDNAVLNLVLRKKVVSRHSTEKNRRPKEHSNSNKPAPGPTGQDKDTKDSPQINLSRGHDKKKKELLDVCYSPDGGVLAVACKNGLIYLLSVEEKFKRFAACRLQHNAILLRMNFSKDGSIIQANDTSMSLSYWNSDTGVQLTDARHLRDINWSAWTSTCGWPVQGIHSATDGSVGSHERISAVCRSLDETLLLTGGHNGCNGAIKLFIFPALQGSTLAVCSGHASVVNDVSFLSGDESAVSCGGLNDSAIMLWSVKRI